MPSINQWQTPDWVKSSFQAIIILIMTLMLNEWGKFREELTSIRTDLSVLAENTRMTKEVLNIEISQIKMMIERKASVESLNHVEKRVDMIEKIVRK